ncbi:MAG: hypothetical protein A2147_01385 [Chloroflexi bacterium RBG_16_57_8]|nr:MAG: hypothetical protein A2147_01385 [Chloroflexi bacterium RBG_16_57_8]
MKKKTTLVVTALVAIATLSTLGALAYAAETSTGPSGVVGRYIEDVASHRLSDAYSLTTQGFQDIIPLNAFVKYHEISNYGDGLNYKAGPTVKTQDDEATVEISGKTGSGEGFLQLSREGDEWKIDLDWQQFFAVKCNLLPSIAELTKDDVSVTLRYFVVYPTTQNARGFTHARLDISNSGQRGIRWGLPVPGSEGGYFEDPVSGKRFYPSYGYGIQASATQDVQYIPRDGGLGTILIGPNAEATVYVDVEQIIPDTVKELNVFFGGFSFTDTDGAWSMAIEDAPFRFEAVPAE